MIHHHTYELFKNNLSGDSVLLLGDQEMNLNEQVQGFNAAKWLSKAHKIKAVDLDINGKAKIEADLSKPLTAKDIGKYDMVADFGTIEHVNSLYNALKNVFNLTKTGGKMLHANPKIGHFPGHMREDKKNCHKFSVEFWQEYAKACNLILIECREQAAYGNTTTGIEVYAVLGKTSDSKPISKTKFNSLKKYVFTE